MTALPNGLIQFATLNKERGRPTPNDDRVAIIQGGASGDNRA